MTIRIVLSGASSLSQHWGPVVHFPGALVYPTVRVVQTEHAPSRAVPLDRAVDVDIGLHIGFISVQVRT